MKQEWEILTLNNYLTEEFFPTGLPRGTTFTRTFAATESLPAVKVGLGIIKDERGVSLVDAVPEIKHARVVTLNTFINEVAEQYLRLSDMFPDQWQEALLLELGYVKKMNHRANTPAHNYNLFAHIPEKERLSLLTKHGFHKIATVVAYGHTDDIDKILTTLDELNEELSETANYGTLMNLLRAGVPPEELHVAVQLPEEMVLEIYSDEQA